MAATVKRLVAFDSYHSLHMSRCGFTLTAHHQFLRFSGMRKKNRGNGNNFCIHSFIDFTNKFTLLSAFGICCVRHFAREACFIFLVVQIVAYFTVRDHRVVHIVVMLR